MENNGMNVAVSTEVTEVTEVMETEEMQDTEYSASEEHATSENDVSKYYRNEVILQGTVISVQAQSKYSSVQIITDEATSKAIPEIIFYRPLPRSITPKTRVRIKGYCYTRINKENENNIMFDTVFIGSSIEKAPRALADYIEPEHLSAREGGFGPDINRIVCVGSCSNIIELKNGVTLLVMETVFGKQKRYVEFFCFRRQADFLKKEVTKGDLVAVYGSISTNQDKVGIRNAKQDAVCRDISKIK